MNDMVSGLGRLLGVAWHLDRRRFVVASTLLALGSVSTPVVALGAGRLVDAVTGVGSGGVLGWALVVSMALVGELMLGHFAHLYYFELAELTEEHFNRQLVRLVNGDPFLERIDDPAFADRVDLLRQDVMQMRTTVQAGLQLAATVVQLGLTALVLGLVSPWLLLLLLAAATPVLVGRRAEAEMQSVRETQAATTRMVRHFRRLATSPGSQKEIRLSGGSDFLIERQAKLLERYRAAMARADRRYAILRAAGQMAFAMGYGLAILWTLDLARRGAATPGDVVLTVVLALQLSTQMAAGVEQLAAVHRGIAGLGRFEALRAETGRRPSAAGSGPVPATAGGGITIEGLTFRYPGAQSETLSGIDLHLPAGSSVALIGENGAGKSTLLKVLTGLYPPTSGRLVVGGVDLASARPDAWHRRTATLFQDFARVELTLQHSVGVGHVEDVEDEAVVGGALGRAGATDLAETIGLGGTVGSAYADGRELSGGQWQKVGFARALMRPDPILLVLDEPAAALDPLAEERITDAYQATARDVAAESGGVTLFVTHRMSTVRLADMVVVLHDGRVVEQGSHNELVTAGGRYADLWNLQAHAYDRDPGGA